MAKRLKFWGWGYEDEVVPPAELRWMESTWAERFGVAGFSVTPTPAAEEIRLPAPRIAPPASLAAICTTDHYERVLHSYSKSFPDIIRVYRRECPSPADVVALPRNERDVVDLLDWCYGANAAVVPFGGGSSVVGGVTPPTGGGHAAVVSMDLRNLGKVLEIDEVSQCARIQAGTFGPSLEAQLKGAGLTLRHFPQSFQCSTLGGWIATRAGGHFATLYTHIDDLVESLRVVTPSGVLETRRLPGSGAGPSPDRMFIGSEGTLGVITAATLKLTPLPETVRTLRALYRDVHSAAKAVARLMRQPATPCALEFMDGEAVRLAREIGGADIPEAGALLMIEVDGSHDAMPAAVAAISAAASGEGLIALDSAQSADEVHKLWAARKALSPALRSIAPKKINEDVVVPVSRIPDLVQTVTEISKRSGIPIVCFGHAGNGNLHVNLMFDPNNQMQAKNAPGALAEVFTRVIELGGTLSGEHGIGIAKRPFMTQAIPAETLAMMQLIKAQFDPDGILNPGKLLP